MGEWSDEWSAKGKKNVCGTVPSVIEMQSEGGAACALTDDLHGVAGPAPHDPEDVEDRGRAHIPCACT